MISGVLYDLDTLANGFEITGNNIVSDDLRDIARRVNDAADLLVLAHQQLFNESFQSARESVNNVFMAALSGIIIAQNNEDGQ